MIMVHLCHCKEVGTLLPREGPIFNAAEVNRIVKYR